MIRKLTVILATSLLLATGPVLADTAKGRIKYISDKANTIQLDVKDKPAVVVRFDANTAYDGVAGIDDLLPPDLIQVEYQPGQPASKIKKIVFGLPAGTEIDIHEMLAILQGQRGPYTLGDARPAARYPDGHIPSAISTPGNDKEAFLASLPEDKNRLLVFYCGGPTCPYTGKAIEMAQAVGHTNLKGFQAGLPGWKKNKLPVHASPRWLAKNLDPHHVVLDVRPPVQAAAAHIPGAVSLPAERIQAMTQGFIDRQVEAKLPGVSDKRAPIILYADSHADQGVLIALRELISWGYKGARVLEGGFQQWTAEGLPSASQALATTIEYTPKKVEGAISGEAFLALAGEPAKALLLDVRTVAETAQSGTFAGGAHIPLDALEGRIGELPKEREIITYCANGIRAEMAYEALKEKGFKVRFLNQVVNFAEDGEPRL